MNQWKTTQTSGNCSDSSAALISICRISLLSARNARESCVFIWITFVAPVCSDRFSQPQSLTPL
jgi:hypothetical protein